MPFAGVVPRMDTDVMMPSRRLSAASSMTTSTAVNNTNPLVMNAINKNLAINEWGGWYKLRIDDRPTRPVNISMGMLCMGCVQNNPAKGDILSPDVIMQVRCVSWQQMGRCHEHVVYGDVVSTLLQHMLMRPTTCPSFVAHSILQAYPSTKVSPAEGWHIDRHYQAAKENHCQSLHTHPTSVSSVFSLPTMSPSRVVQKPTSACPAVFLTMPAALSKAA